MILNLNPHSGVPLYRQIAQQLRARIVSGKITAGEQIPSARDLSADLKVNPLTIQKVYQILEHDGLVETRRGLGTFVVEKQKIISIKEKLSLLHPSIHQLVSESIQMELTLETLLQEIQKTIFRRKEIMNAIECHQVTRSYGPQKALDQFSLDIPSGSIYGFLGRNGSGKTTLIRMLVGLMWPDQGEIKVLGQNPRNFTVEDRQKIGYLSEKQILPPALKIGQIVDFCRPLYPKWDDSLIQRLSNRFDLDPKKKIKDLSNGQQRQVGFMLALAQKPEVLILDEPASTLDVVARREFLDEILELIREEERTVLFSTHILSDVERIADRIGILKDGKLVVDEPLDSLKENVKQIRFSSRSGSTPQISLPHIYRTKKDKSELLVTARVDDPQQIQEAARNANCDYEILSLGLEDLFVEISSKNI